MELETAPILNPIAPSSFSLATYVVFLLALALIMALTYWLMGKAERKRRDTFLKANADTNLRVNRHNTDVIYKIDDEKENTFRATLVWRGKAPAKAEDPFWADKENFAAFEPAKFRASQSSKSHFK